MWTLRLDVRLVAALALVTGVASCKFPVPPPLDADAAVDGPMVDADIDGDPGDAILTTSQAPHDFGDVTVGQSSAVLQVLVRNAGTRASGVLAVTLAGNHPGDYAIVPTGGADDCAGATLDVGEVCTAQVRFRPTVPGERTATLSVAATPGGAAEVPLAGNGLTAGDLEIVAGAALDFGTVEIQQQTSGQDVTVRNAGQTAIPQLTVMLADAMNYTKVSDSCHMAALGAGESCTVRVRFNPTVVGALPTSISIRQSPQIGVAASATGAGSASVQVSKTGTGTISSAPAGLTCGTGCATATHAFTQTPVTLLATETPGHVFSGWGGACAPSGTVPMCSLALTQPLTTASATFTQVFTLTVSVTGMGVVAANPAGISCGNGNTDCAEDYPTGTMVTLTVDPTPGWGVYAWTGATCAQGQTTCAVTMNQARNVGVELRQQYTLEVSTTGTGTVTSDIGGIACPGTCTRTYFSGQTVVLTATPGSAGAGSRHVLSSWGGACSGSMSTCAVSMTQNRSASAAFQLQHQLSVAIAGSGSGTVTGPAGFSCSSGTCTQYYDASTNVALTATPSAISVFDGFSGACASGTCAMTEPVSTTATFPHAFTVAAGDGHACRVRGNGTLWCWGSNSSGQLGDGSSIQRTVPIQVGSATTWASVAAGSAHTCATRTNGTLWCWGANTYGQLGDGTNTGKSVPTQIGSGTTWTSVAAGEHHACATRGDGTLWCWGRNLYGQLGDTTTSNRNTPGQVGTATAWGAVATGYTHTCARQTDGSLWCWGRNLYGEIGDSTTMQRSTPVQVGALTSWARVSAGNGMTCASRTNGTLWCWGRNAYGQLGDGTSTDRDVPTQVGTATNWSGIAAGSTHTCGTRTNRTLWCWGRNRYGHLGTGTQVDRNTPVQIGDETTWLVVAAGESLTCARRTDGTAWCWGLNTAGEVGDGAGGDQLTPIQAGTATTWSSGESGELHSCAYRSDGTLWCWGGNTRGQLGSGDSTERNVPTQVGSATDWAIVSLGSNHACGLKQDAVIRPLSCWGANDAGQIGDGTQTDRATPTLAGSSLARWSSVASGYRHTCGISNSGSLYCWGDNSAGQLGDGTIENRTSPTQVGALTTWQIVSTGRFHTCATRSDGTLWCWGSNLSGQLGLGGGPNAVSSPTQVGTAATWASVVAGAGHTCATRTNGTLWCWGGNTYGQVGDGTTTQRTSPTQVGTATTWATVATAADGNHSCARRTNNTLWCWGRNNAGQLGIGTTTNATSPTQVGTQTNWAALAPGVSHSCAIRTNGTLWCWGSAAWGRLGDGSAWRTVPVLADPGP